jgi:hypothetical protein
VAFMLVHFFCLLEFKFRFEFYCLNPFLAIQNPKPLFPYTPYPRQAQPVLAPNPPSAPARAAAGRRSPLNPALQPNPAAGLAPQPNSPPAFARSPARPPAQFCAARGPASPPVRLPASAPSVADQWGLLVIPELGSSPTRTRPRRRLGVRAPHAFSAWPARQGRVPGLYKPSPPPGPPTRRHPSPSRQAFVRHRRPKP